MKHECWPLGPKGCLRTAIIIDKMIGGRKLFFCLPNHVFCWPTLQKKLPYHKENLEIATIFPLEMRFKDRNALNFVSRLSRFLQFLQFLRLLPLIENAPAPRIKKMVLLILKYINLVENKAKQANRCDGVYRRTNALQTNQQTN